MSTPDFFDLHDVGFGRFEAAYAFALGNQTDDLLWVRLAKGAQPVYLYSKSQQHLWNYNFANHVGMSRHASGTFSAASDQSLQKRLETAKAGFLFRSKVAVIEQRCTVTEEKALALQIQEMQVNQWRISSCDELLFFARTANNPAIATRNSYLCGEQYWNVAGNKWMSARSPDTYNGCLDHLGYFFCLDLPQAMLLRLVRMGAIGLKSVSNDFVFENFDTSSAPDYFKPALELDCRMARLPKLSPDMLRDPNQGYWELFGQDPAWLQEAGLRARDPLADMQDGEVAIDFGTSSTVVALQIKGRKEVLRIGATDYDQAVQPHDFENPTVLELVDLEGLLSAWNSTAYRPPIRWDHVRCAHEAQQSLRNNQDDPQRVASIMTRLKQWARRESGTPLLQLADQVARSTLALPTLKARNPSQHQLLEVDAHYEFDPIELYAYFLGLYINWRQRGIFSRYVLSFPVRYKNSVKQNILASFRRGLQRSWPRTLAEQPEALAGFVVREGASEPAAYAAAAMPALKLRPTDPGLAYAVFDFGGGTTDFDFGLYRKAITAQEKELEFSEVFEHFGASGDNDLGGEGLLEILAFRLLQHNRDACAAKRLCFAHPPVSLNETGLESLLADNQTATTNTVLLVGKLREFWQNHGQSSVSSAGVFDIRLIDRDGQPQNVQLELNEDELALELAERITRGAMQFLQALHDAFAGRPRPESIQVLLAGNSCRTRWVGVCFAALGQLQTQTELPEGWQGVEALVANWLNGQDADTAQSNDALLAQAFYGPLQALRERMQALFGDHPPTLLIQPPLPVDMQQMQKPSAKTGVALGLLRLGEGSAIHVIDHSNASGEARFAHFVGKDVAGCLEPVVAPSSVYRQWQRMGLARAAEGRAVLRCYHTTAPEASSGQLEVDSPVVLHKLLEFSRDAVGTPVWLRPIDPDTLEVCCQPAQPDDDGADVQLVRLG